MSGTETKTEVFTITETGESAVESNTNKTRCIFEQYVQPCLAELFGTSLFVFVGCASVIGNVSQASGAIQPALAHGLALGVLIMILGQISGGHFNPAVSLSVYLCGGMELRLLLPYVLAQMSGGMIGAGLSKAIYPSSVYDASIGAAFVPSSDLAATTLAEAVMSMFLTTVVCMGAVNGQTRSPWAPFAIGLTVTANIFAGGIVSGACMNPARAFGPAVAANRWNHHWVYWVGPTCGALLTVSFIRLLLGDQKTRVVLK
ncbi:aquaporin-8-like [Centropristis striata]|uniref:aquaporin-8-like n=1 Tax=Centropristis striata TaxID=184440 RepID=UPI0027DF558C|nr:aquaporin-8-like [Centropristis striata]